MSRQEEDMIPDPSEFIYTDDGTISPKLMISFMGNMSRNIGSLVEATKTSNKQIDAIQESVQELIKAETDRRISDTTVEHQLQRLNNRVDDRKKEIQDCNDLAKKALDRVDSLQTSFNASCDVTKKEIKDDVEKDIDGKINSIKSNVKVGWAVLTVTGILLLSLTGTIFNSAMDTLHNVNKDLT